MSQTASHNNAQSAPCHAQPIGGDFGADGQQERGGPFNRGGEIPQSGYAFQGSDISSQSFTPREAETAGDSGGRPALGRLARRELASLAAIDGAVNGARPASDDAPIGMDDCPPLPDRVSRAMRKAGRRLHERGRLIGDDRVLDMARGVMARGLPVMEELMTAAANEPSDRIGALKATTSVYQAIRAASGPSQQVGIVIQGAPASTPESDLAAFEAAFERVD